MQLICLPIVSVRQKPSNRSELLTQEVLGRTVDVIERRRGWLRCRLSDGYEGWIPERAACEDALFSPTHIVVGRFAGIDLGGGDRLTIPMGSLVMVGRQGKMPRVRLPDGSQGRIESGVLRSLRRFPLAVKAFDRVIREVMGTPYIWGGKSTFGFDCSGLVQFVYSFIGVNLPRDSKDQARIGQKVTSLSRSRALDLLFFGKQTVDHVAIHLGNMLILHASGWVKIESLSRSDARFRRDLLESLVVIRRVIA